MNESVMVKTNLFGAWCGVFYCVLLLLGWWIIGGYYPLHQPAAGAEEIAAFYQESNPFRLRLGLIIVMWGAALFIPFTATMADMVERSEGRSGPLTKITLMAGYSNALLTFYPQLYWLANAFRPDEHPVEIIYMINDIAWLQFIGGLSLIMAMFLTVAVVAFCDRRENAPFPRWFGYMSVWVFVLFLPDQLLFFFKDGPFAWDGVIAFWIPLTIFCSWFIVGFYLMRKAILKEQRLAENA